MPKPPGAPLSNGVILPRKPEEKPIAYLYGTPPFVA